ncbi:hypothetical protein BU25DRAFT_459510 [Macroventuria anomochaeta]|uniref:Uncharacterized protein n=1 Tax=Macroventuria anomochaeta TaxID=301207 RepID=A0ACB6RZ02_9PLEO|nr:uncharacterized protein BU25DRAFT_459510 [Macroventuria anomochaeta]KAF2626378.1 hypothetical protein BU25DRAFT_459510 [Macroventuria anomochaeta]
MTEPEPKPEPERGPLTTEALKQLERLQSEAFTQFKAALARLELHVEERKDSAQRTDSWVKFERCRSVSEGRVPASHFDSDTQPVSKKFTIAGRHYNEFIPGAFSWSFPGSGSLPDLDNADGEPAADRELAADAQQTTVEVEDLLAAQPEVEPDINGHADSALLSKASSPTLPHTDLGANIDGYGEAMSSLFGPFGSDGMVPSNLLGNEAQSASKSGADDAPSGTPHSPI